MSEEYKCSKYGSNECDGAHCDGDHRGRSNCPIWNTSEEIANVVRIMMSHIKNGKLQDVMT